MSAGVPVGKGQGVRGRRKGSRVAGATVLLVVAVALTAASIAIGERAFLWASLALGIVAAILLASGRRARKSAPPHADHPRLDHPEDHP